MRISISETTQNFQPIKLDTQSDLAQHMLAYNWSPGVFKDNNRSNAAFIAAESIGLDFDGGLTLKEAKLKFAKYKHIIGTTRSHQIEKHGEIQDRFRVVLFLDRPIKDREDYKYTIKSLIKQFPDADPACKDAARFFYPCTNIVSNKLTGELLSWTEQPIKEVIQPTKEVIGRGTLCHKSLEFFVTGAKPGTANPRLFEAAKDAQEQGYTKGEVIHMVQHMIDGGGSWAHPELSEKDIGTIESAFNNPPNGEPNIKRSNLNLKSIEKLSEGHSELTWQVDRLFLEGGMSAIVGPPKSGKSTLTRQLALATLRGHRYLNRKVKQGPVIYCALEEHAVLLNKQMKSIGIKNDDDIHVHVGPLSVNQDMEALTDAIYEIKPVLVVLDTLSLFADIKSINDYEEVNKAMQKIRQLARESNTHILLIHHSSKGDINGFHRIMGSQAIFGALDSIFMFNVSGDKRFATTTGRGMDNFQSVELLYDSILDIYSLGNKQEDF